MLTAADLTIDEEFRELLPPLDADEHEQLRISVAREGFRDPLVAWLGHGIVVDGHHRWAIWDQFYRDDETRQPDVIERPFADRHAVTRWMIANQIARRNLTTGQRAFLALQLKPGLAADAKRRQKEGGEGGVLNSEQLGKTDDQAAAAVGVSRDSVRKAEEIVESGDAEVISDVQAGRISLNEAHQQVKPPREQRPDESASESDRAEKKLVKWIDKMIDTIQEQAAKLQDDRRAELIERLKFLLGTLEGEQ